nr:sugar phosphate isomerase/epimerase [Acidobacteriota bacterium]
VLPYIRPEDRGDLDFFRRLTDKMNRAGEQCHAAGLQFCYHNHAFEFQGEKDQRPIDIMIERLDLKNVGFEMDVFWVSVAGNDPVAMLRQLKGRVPLVHLKDEKRGAPVQYNEKVSKDTFQEVGHGSLDFPAILRAAEAAGVKHYFVEQDQTAGDPVASLKQSYDYLRSVKI